jgi:acetyl esterase
MSEIKLTWFERFQADAARFLGRRLPGWLQLILSGRRQLVVGEQRFAPCLQLMLTLSRLRTSYGLAEPNPVEARARFHRETVTFDGPKTHVEAAAVHGISREGRQLRARRYSPAGASGRSRELLVYLHGGGFVIGDLDTHDEVCRLLCLHADTHVLSVEYSLAPEHKYPVAVEEALAAFRWAQAHAGDEEFGADPARVSIGGDSAGGL